MRLPEHFVAPYDIDHEQDVFDRFQDVRDHIERPRDGIALFLAEDDLKGAHNDLKNNADIDHDENTRALFGYLISAQMFGKVHDTVDDIVYKEELRHISADRDQIADLIF